MVDFRHDQAAGLRRLFAHRQLRVLTFASGSAGVGKTSVVANLASLLARQGLQVLVVDENEGGKGQAAFFGLRPRADLLQVLNHQCTFAEILMMPLPGVMILPAGRAAHRFGTLLPEQQEVLLQGVAALEHPVDVVLVDSCRDASRIFSPWSLAAGETVVVVSGQSSAITDAYVFIKKASQAFAQRRFRILVNRVRHLEEGRVIYQNLYRLAAQRGVARLEYGGAIPFDDNLRQVARTFQPVALALPEAPAAEALRDFATEVLHWPAAEYEHGGMEALMRHLLQLGPATAPQILQA